MVCAPWFLHDHFVFKKLETLCELRKEVDMPLNKETKLSQTITSRY